LRKFIYGFAQDAGQWWKKLKETMAGCNLNTRNPDPCLVIKHTKGDEPLSFGIMYVDVGCIIATPQTIKL
jgi:hypothetical protein